MPDDPIESAFIQCVGCLNIIEIEAPQSQWDDYKAHRSQKHIQDIFPDMSRDLREMFISRICPDCFKALGDEEDVA